MSLMRFGHTLSKERKEELSSRVATLNYQLCYFVAECNEIFKNPSSGDEIRYSNPYNKTRKSYSISELTVDFSMAVAKAAEHLEPHEPYTPTQVPHREDPRVLENISKLSKPIIWCFTLCGGYQRDDLDNRIKNLISNADELIKETANLSVEVLGLHTKSANHAYQSMQNLVQRYHWHTTAYQQLDNRLNLHFSQKLVRDKALAQSKHHDPNRLQDYFRTASLVTTLIELCQIIEGTSQRVDTLGIEISPAALFDQLISELNREEISDFDLKTFPPLELEIVSAVKGPSEYQYAALEGHVSPAATAVRFDRAISAVFKGTRIENGKIPSDIRKARERMLVAAESKFTEVMGPDPIFSEDEDENLKLVDSRHTSQMDKITEALRVCGVVDRISLESDYSDYLTVEEVRRRVNVMNQTVNRIQEIASESRISESAYLLFFERLKNSHELWNLSGREFDERMNTGIALLENLKVTQHSFKQSENPMQELLQSRTISPFSLSWFNTFSSLTEQEN